MRRRFGGLENVHMGLGVDNIPYELDNTWSENENLNAVALKMFDDALETIFKDRNLSGFDFKVQSDLSDFNIMFGFEPAYQYDPYLMFCITAAYKDSYMETGVATSEYATEVRTDKHSRVVDEDCDSDFVNFVDKWYDELRGTIIRAI